MDRNSQRALVECDCMELTCDSRSLHVLTGGLRNKSGALQVAACGGGDGRAATRDAARSTHAPQPLPPSIFDVLRLRRGIY